MPHGDADIGVFTPRSTFFDHGRFGRLFPTLPPFASDTPLYGQCSPSWACQVDRWMPVMISATRSP